MKWKDFTRTLVGRKTIDEGDLDVLEETLIGADLGVDLTVQLIEQLTEKVREQRYLNKTELRGLLADLLVALCKPRAADFGEGMGVVVLVGVNGVGKTTTAARLAQHYQQQGRRVVLGAADTFRAAAQAQLQTWATAVGCAFFDSKQGEDPASVAHRTLTYAAEHNHDRVIIDTAGRLHNKVHLMRELSRITHVVAKVVPSAAMATWLVVDATTGQNAQNQTTMFAEATPLNGLILTKVDGTAKGGIVFQLAQSLPVQFIGTGEQLADLEPFVAEKFAQSFLPTF